MSKRKIGLKELHAIDGDRGVAVEQAVGAISPVLARTLVEHGFGTVFARAELGRRERELMTVAILGAIGGAEPQLAVHVEAALRCGVEPEELVAAAEHVSVYAGYPRALNMLFKTRDTLAEMNVEPIASERVVTLNGRETLVSDSGGEGEPLILIHALGVDRRMWQQATALLARRYRVIAYDFRGHGHAAGMDAPFTLQDMADDLKDLMDVLGLEQAHIAGLALGGVVAQVFARSYPQRLCKLALICTMAKALDAFEIRARAGLEEGMEAQIVPSLTRWFLPETLAANEWPVRYARESILRAFPEDWAFAWRALAGVDTWSDLPEITCPSLLLAAEFDRSATPAMMREMAGRMPNATYREVAGASHMLALERPAEVAQALLDFLGD